MCFTTSCWRVCIPDRSGIQIKSVIPGLVSLSWYGVWFVCLFNQKFIRPLRCFGWMAFDFLHRRNASKPAVQASSTRNEFRSETGGMEWNEFLWNGTEVEWNGMEWNGMNKWNFRNGFRLIPVSVLFKRIHIKIKKNIFPTQTALNKHRTFRDTVCVRDCRTFTKQSGVSPESPPEGNAQSIELKKKLN